jgi:hypothetical protein
MGEMKNAYNILVGKPEGKRPLGRPRILKWILWKQGGAAWIGFIWLRIGTGGGSCDHRNDPSGSVESGEFLDY